jgi:uncharacterized integral membrane protein
MRQSLRIVSWIVTAPITIIVVLFAISNRDDVTLHLRPLPFDLTIRVWALTLIQLFVGFLLGGIVTWIGDRRHRRNERQLAKRVKALEQALAEARGQAVESERIVAEHRRSTALPIAGAA